MFDLRRREFITRRGGRVAPEGARAAAGKSRSDRVSGFRASFCTG